MLLKCMVVLAILVGALCVSTRTAAAPSRFDTAECSRCKGCFADTCCDTGGGLIAIVQEPIFRNGTCENGSPCATTPCVPDGVLEVQNVSQRDLWYCVNGLRATKLGAGDALLVSFREPDKIECKTTCANSVNYDFHASADCNAATPAFYRLKCTACIGTAPTVK
jgi:hypothetical protein